MGLGYVYGGWGVAETFLFLTFPILTSWLILKPQICCVDQMRLFQRRGLPMPGR